ncbi:hypothetical protein CASFOL_037807 [Castilleja foliolosa]|uniref:Uncharacterized protein n=1 Tax=Castilleja foliolosa TaxID=1961234 RepID=A0ABD3BKC5_9LAMI
MTPGWQTATCCTTEFGERRERWCWAERKKTDRGLSVDGFCGRAGHTSRAKAASAAVMASNGGLTASG